MWTSAVLHINRQAETGSVLDCHVGLCKLRLTLIKQGKSSFICNKTQTKHPETKLKICINTGSKQKLLKSFYNN